MRKRSVLPFAAAAVVALSVVAGCHHRQVATVPTSAPPMAKTAPTPVPAPTPMKEVTETFPTQPIGSSSMSSSNASNRLERVYFAFDQYGFIQDDQKRLQDDAKWLKGHPSDRVLISGNCDERGTVQYNLALGERRAQAARQYLIDLGVDPSRIQIVSYGKERPLDPGHTEAAWAKNRRDDFTEIVSGAGTSGAGAS